MSLFVSVLSGKGSGTVVTVSAAFAEGADLKILDLPATDDHGRPLPPRPVTRPKAEEPNPKPAGDGAQPKKGATK